MQELSVPQTVRDCLTGTVGQYSDIIENTIMKITVIDTVKFSRYQNTMMVNTCHYPHKSERSSYIIWDVITQGVSYLLGSAPFCTSIVLFQ